ncbi:transmembrane protein 135-like [Styela clava]
MKFTCAKIRGVNNFLNYSISDQYAVILCAEKASLVNSINILESLASGFIGRNFFRHSKLSEFIWLQMSVISKIGSDKILGPLDSVHYTCYEVGHTWNSSCLLTYLDTFHKAFAYSLKLYAPFYALSALWKFRKKTTDKRKLMKNALLSTLRSSFFLAMNGTYFIIVFCCYGKIVGKYHGIAGFIVGAVASFLSIILERSSRRGMLSIYSLNLALETLFKMSVSRGFVSRINGGEVYLFAFTNLVYMRLFRSSNLPPVIQSVVEKIMGKEETMTILPGERRLSSDTLVDNTKLSQSFLRAKKLHDFVLKNLNRLGPNTPCCKHNSSCSVYVIKGTLKYFSLGCAFHVLLKYRTILQSILTRNTSLLKKAFSDLSLAKFFCAYVALFRVVNCSLRWMTSSDNPKLFGSIAGLISGFSSVFYPSTGIAMYVFTKLLDILCMKAVSANWFPRIPNFDIVVYSFSLGILFHAAVFEPHNIRPSYWSFLKALSGYKFPLMFRKLLDKFGTEASRMYPDFVPDLDPKYVKTEEVKRVLAQFGKWR